LEEYAPGKQRRVHTFKQNGIPTVTVKVPKDNDHAGESGDATPVAMDWKDAATPATRRKVINLVLQDSTRKPVIKFKPPVELRVRLTDAELNSPTSKLLYQHPKNGWTDLSATKDRATGEFVTQISEWFDDPALGVDP
jgi:hypothetical protein